MGERPGKAHVRDRSYVAFTNSRVLTAKKQRFVDAMEVLLDIAKESADVLPPLKSCLGGINVLIKLYQVRSNLIVARSR